MGLLEENGRIWLAQGEQSLIAADEVPLAGRHGLLNVLAAYALADAAGLPLTDLAGAVRSFQSLPHRCQKVAIKRGVSYINDSKATNLGAALAAIQGLSQDYNRLWLVMGGEGKGQDFAVLRTALQSSIAGVALIGRDASLLAEHLPEGMPSWYTKNLEAAIQQLETRAIAGDAVVLSPACASFDQFDSYAQRGEVFIRCVQNLPE
jgi:UDP-N-acetylmuramoylalanine--D-glutamate ligase